MSLRLGVGCGTLLLDIPRAMGPAVGASRAAKPPSFVEGNPFALINTLQLPTRNTKFIIEPIYWGHIHYCGVGSVYD